MYDKARETWIFAQYTNKCVLVVYSIRVNLPVGQILTLLTQKSFLTGRLILALELIGNTLMVSDSSV